MKAIFTTILALLLTFSFTDAQDTLYIYKSGEVVGMRAVADIDSIIFYKPGPIPAVNKTALADSIAAATAVLTEAVEGVASGQYQIGSKAELQNILTIALIIYNDPLSTQADINNTVANLAAAVSLFKSKVIIPIAETNLVAQWTFSEGSGTTVTDASSNHLNGILMTGHPTIAGSGAIPTWSDDRYGIANKALNFQKGAHIEVPFQEVLIPSEITISLWVKVDTTWSNNYMISEKYWEGYKFQLQDGNKPFFTFKTSDNQYVDRDWNYSGLPLNEWHHIAITLKSGEESFFGDGALIYTWTGFTGTINTSLSNPQTFAIGQEIPNILTGISAADDPAQWGIGYFKGSMDEIRIYNKALSSKQIEIIYNMEKVPVK